VTTVALLSDLGPRTPQTILSLGTSGVRRLVDVREASGWRSLRAALTDERGNPVQRMALARLADDLHDANPDCWRFFQALFLCPAHVSSVRRLSEQLGVLPSTLMSRFFRAKLPPPKRYLAMARLVRAAHLFENQGFSVANVANHLEYSSPQSFGRHIRAILGVTAQEFRERYDGEGMLERFRGDLVVPHLATLRYLAPLRRSTSLPHRHSFAPARQLAG
jgi:AraC-like DNA-binding protein